MSIYNEEQQLIGAENRIKNGNFTPEQISSALEFEDYLFSLGLSVLRILKYMVDVNVILKQFPNLDLKNITEQDLIRILGYLERKYTVEETKNGYKYFLRKLLDWQKRDSKNLVPIKKKIRNSKLPDDMYTEDEIHQMIEAANKERDRAFIAVLYEIGPRIGEHASPRLKHIIPDEHGIVLMVDGKTGMRRVRLIWSVAYLQAWLEVHPFKDNPEAPLWVSTKTPYESLNYRAMDMILKRTGKRAGIKKRIHAHNFRHSRCTHVASHLTESQMKVYFGWTGDSNMPKIYVHLSGKDVDDAILNLYGIDKNNKLSDPQFSIVKCPRCKQIIPSMSSFCNYCGMVLKIDHAHRIDELQDKAKELMIKLIKENPELVELLEEI